MLRGRSAPVARNAPTGLVTGLPAPAPIRPHELLRPATGTATPGNVPGSQRSADLRRHGGGCARQRRPRRPIERGVQCQKPPSGSPRCEAGRRHRTRYSKLSGTYRKHHRFGRSRAGCESWVLLTGARCPRAATNSWSFSFGKCRGGDFKSMSDSFSRTQAANSQMSSVSCL